MSGPADADGTPLSLGSEVERVARVFEVDANKKSRLDLATAGQIVLLAGLRDATTGDTLCHPDHPLLLEHLTAENPVSVTAKGRTVDEWKLKPAAQNHLLDCLTMAAVGGSILGGALGFWSLPREFFPTEDRNVFFLRTVAPEGTSFPYMDARMAELEQELMAAVPERKVMLTRVASGPGGVIAPVNSGQYVFPLVPREERSRTQQEIVKSVSGQLRDVTAFQVVLGGAAGSQTDRWGAATVRASCR
jgi:hypothetical protein